MIKAVIFDVGGVLISSEMKFVIEDIKTTLNLNTTTFEKPWNDLLPLLGTGKISEEEFWQKFLIQTHTPATFSTEESFFLREYLKRTHPHEEVLTLVRKLKEKGYKLALLSDTIASHVTANERFGFYDDFPIKIFSNEVGFSKPGKEIFKLALEKLQTRPEETIFIDDLEKNVIAAKDLGLIGMLYKDAPQLKKEFTSRSLLD